MKTQDRPLETGSDALAGAIGLQTITRQSEIDSVLTSDQVTLFSSPPVSENVNRQTISELEVQIPQRSEQNIEAIDKSLGEKLASYRAETGRTIDHAAAISFLRRMSQHDDLPKSQKAANLAQAKQDLVNTLGLDVVQLDNACVTAGKWTNLMVIPTDLLGLTPVVVSEMLRQFSSLGAVPQAVIGLVLQTAVQAAGPYVSAHLLPAALEIQRQVREGQPKRYGATGQMEQQTKNMRAETATLQALMKRNGEDGTPQVDEETLTRQIERLATEVNGYKDSSNLNLMRYTTYMPENAVRMLRATALVAGLWASFGAAMSGDKRASDVPIAMLVQVVAVAVSWVAHWVWAGPERDRIMLDKLLDSDVQKFGPEMAKSLLERQQPTDADGPSTITNIDEQAEKELRSMWKSRLEVQLGMAGILFKAEHVRMVDELASKLGMDPGDLSYLVELRQKAAKPVPPLAATEGTRLAELKAKMPSYQEQPQPSAADKRSDTLLHLSREEEAEFQRLDAKEAAVRAARSDADDQVNLEGRYQALRQGLQPADVEAVQRLENDLAGMVSDQARLKSGDWLAMDVERKALLDETLSGKPSASTMSMYMQYLFGAIAGDHGAVKTGHGIAKYVKSRYEEFAPLVEFRYGKSFQLLVGGSATALTVASANRVLTATGNRPSLEWRIPSSVIPLAVSYLADLTGGVLVNEKLMARAELRSQYAHGQPSTGAKVGLSIAAVLKDSVCVVREAVRLTTGAYTHAQAVKAIEEARGRIVDMNAKNVVIQPPQEPRPQPERLVELS